MPQLSNLFSSTLKIKKSGEIASFCFQLFFVIQLRHDTYASEVRSPNLEVNNCSKFMFLACFFNHVVK